MLDLLGILIGFTLQLIGAEHDTLDICVNKPLGYLVGNPNDCNSYFICGILPNLRNCAEGLQFDDVRKECDKPENVKCQSVDTRSENFDNQLNADWWSHKPRPVFIAVDVNSGQPVDPMDKYDPMHIECRHLGAYFLPHPTSCQRYFICAYGHLLQHKCGRGTFWNYKRSECELTDVAVCYNNAPMIDETFGDTEYENLAPTNSTPHMSTGVNFATVCYIIETGNAMQTTTEVPNTSKQQLPTLRPILAPAVTTNGSRGDDSNLVCPPYGQSYLSHTQDCTKYYICIAGKPILTMCPKGLYWDNKSGFCNLAKYVRCPQIA